MDRRLEKEKGEEEKFPHPNAKPIADVSRLFIPKPEKHNQ